MNVTQQLGAKKDAHAKRQGDLILGQTVVRMNASDVFAFLSSIGGVFFRIVYRCQDGTVRDMTGRQGVYDSRQDGTVLNVGHRMRDEQRLNLSFWTDARGGKVNTGAGKGYRTIRAEGILILRVQGTDIVTDAGIEALRDSAVSQ